MAGQRWRATHMTGAYGLMGWARAGPKASARVPCNLTMADAGGPLLGWAGAAHGCEAACLPSWPFAPGGSEHNAVFCSVPAGEVRLEGVLWRLATPEDRARARTATFHERRKPRIGPSQGHRLPPPLSGHPSHLRGDRSHPPRRRAAVNGSTSATPTALRKGPAQAVQSIAASPRSPASPNCPWRPPRVPATRLRRCRHPGDPPRRNADRSPKLGGAVNGVFGCGARVRIKTPVPETRSQPKSCNNCRTPTPSRPGCSMA